MSELPSGWAETKLGDIIQFNYGKGLPERNRSGSGFPVYGSNGVVGYHENALVSAESLVIGRKGSVGEVHHSRGPCWPIDTTYFVDQFSGMPARFWYYALKGLDLGGLNRATAIPGLNREDAYQVDVVLPPLTEQKRIADKLDVVLARVDACRERLDRVPVILGRFRHAVLTAATSGRLTEEWRTSTQPPNARALIERMLASNRGRRGVRDSATILEPADADWEYPDSWVCETAASLLRKGVLVDLKDGNHGANHPRVADFTAEGLPFITAAQVNSFRVDYESAYKLSGAPLSRLRVGFARENDVVLTHKGSVGRVALIDRNCVLSPQTTYYRANTDVLLPTYLMYFLASVSFSKQLDAIKSQTTRDFVPISKQYGLWHLIPSLQEQHEIVRRIEGLFAYADRLEARYTAARAQVERLTPALLAKAFRGELVLQASNDEPASVLLERIRAARAAAEGTAGPRRRKGNRPKTSRKAEVLMLTHKDIEDTHLTTILKERGPLTAEALWSASRLDIDDFYDQLKDEEARGLLREKRGDASNAPRILEAA